MNALLSIIFALSCCASLVQNFTVMNYFPIDIYAEWTKYKLEYHKTYESKEEDHRRKALFALSLLEVLKHNSDYEKGLVSNTWAINQFSDMEFSEVPMGYGPNRNDETNSDDVEYYHPHENLAVRNYSPIDIDAEWKKYKLEYQKTYESKEDHRRKALFALSLLEVLKHNSDYEKGLVSNTWAINQFSDMEIHEVPMGFEPIVNDEADQDIEYYHPSPDAEIPDLVDWRTKGVVTPVKDQGFCPSCWAFSVTGTLEGQLAIKNKKLVSLSEQNLVDCSHTTGCERGDWPATGYKYIKENGIDSEKAYPYLGVTEKCHFNKSAVAGRDKGWKKIRKTEDALKKAVATLGPISVAIDAASDFAVHGKHVYKSTKCSSDPYKAGHAVLVVGYGTYKGDDYWLVKNSWGAGWGDEGYIMMARNFNNMCGIANFATVPIV